MGRYLTFCFPSTLLLLHVYGSDDHGDDDTTTTELLRRDRWTCRYETMTFLRYHSFARAAALRWFLARGYLLVSTFSLLDIILLVAGVFAG